MLESLFSGWEGLVIGIVPENCFFLKGPSLREVPCSTDSECLAELSGAFCDLERGLCTCKPDYPVTDTKDCYKGN